ncbi:type II toxin-antitoxin system HipA family toxin [Sphingobacterium humi]|uniref:Type II toxin-antitoxin system HipA family toxin n=1 Tax=Sphingobacterium humi TaxID=1796905 RepID=A0A6N8L0A7_9SPHI|nr:type II toxin-antitoxin system HipA family toxin [Sphingobacterium humi]MVZ61222.1 type II toxin-antitoxin system HipA family toxin [Sphingobacterium humi]
MIHSTSEVKVGLNFGSGIQQVGRLAIRDRVIYFEYDPEFLQKGLEISPFRLPLQTGIIELPMRPFEGLAGVFSDSLPDGWGRLLFDRMAKSQGILPASISPLERLAHVGLFGMGALVYEPDYSPTNEHEIIDLDCLATQTENVLKGTSEDVLPELLALNGSSGGARPKGLIGLSADRNSISYGAKELENHFEPWLVKFPNAQDGYDAGAIEYVYALLAKEAGVFMPEVHLFSSKKGAGYFAVKRFDRESDRRLHMHTVCGLLHSDFRTPSLDYEDLLNLTGALTKDIREVEKMYRLAVFNVLAHNRDDHAKNFSFLMDEQGEWKVAPAYDLTFSSGPNGEQSTMVMGQGKTPNIEHLRKLGQESKLSKKFIEEVIEQTKSALDRWVELSKMYHVQNSNIKLISNFLKKH